MRRNLGLLAPLHSFSMEGTKDGHSRWAFESGVLAMALVGLVGKTTAIIYLFTAILKISHLF